MGRSRPDYLPMPEEFTEPFLGVDGSVIGYRRPDDPSVVRYLPQTPATPKIASYRKSSRPPIDPAGRASAPLIPRGGEEITPYRTKVDPNALAEIPLSFLPGSGDAIAIREGRKNFQDMGRSIEAGDYGKATSDAIMGGYEYLSAAPVIGAVLPSIGGVIRAVKGVTSPSYDVGSPTGLVPAEAGEYVPVPGKPAAVKIPEVGPVEARPIKQLQDAKSKYMQLNFGAPGKEIPEYPKFDKREAERVARAFDIMQHKPDDPRVKRAYDAMVEETIQQYRALQDSGLDVKFMTSDMADPYAASPSLGYKDIVENGRLWVFPTELGHGSDEAFDTLGNPLLKRVGRVGDKSDAVANDAFRVVHDVFGHFAPGNPFFRAPGEERAFVEHAGMYSDEARGAMASETRGQNSWVNYGPHGEANRTASGADTVFADQKVGLMPRWASKVNLPMLGGMVIAPAAALAAARVMLGDEGDQPPRRELAEGGRVPDYLPMPEEYRLGRSARDVAPMRSTHNWVSDVVDWAKENPIEAAATAVSMSPVEPLATAADVGLSAKDVYDAVQKDDWWGAAISGGLGLASAALPFVGYGAVRGAGRGLRANDLPEMLDGLGYKYNVEKSQFMSDRHGPSLSSYYTVETPSGVKRFRVSDHADGALVEGRTDLRLGANVDEQMLDAFNALGVDAPQSVVDAAALSRSERLATQQKRNAAILEADTAAKRARVETQAAELAALGAGHLTGRSRRQAIAALNMKSDRKKRQAIAEIVAADPVLGAGNVVDTAAKKGHNTRPLSGPGPGGQGSRYADIEDARPVAWEGRDLSEMTPDDFAAFGKSHGVDNLGPESPPAVYKYDDGQEFSIPGGTEGTFTYYDLMKMKADGIDPSRIDPQIHAQIQQKLGRTMMPAGPAVSDAQAFNGLLFGMTSPNNPLFPNQLAMSRLRIRGMEDIEKLADMVPWEVGDKVDKARRSRFNKKIAKQFDIQASGDAGGLGVRGSADYTRVAEMAKLFKSDPSFFKRGAEEPWEDFVERVISQTAGLKAKTGSFGVVWQDPLRAGISAIDRHMAKEFYDRLFKTKKDRMQYEKTLTSRWNAKVAERRDLDADLADGTVDKATYKKRVENLPAGDAKMAKGLNTILRQGGGDGFFVDQILSTVGNSKSPKFRGKGGDISKSIPDHLKNANFIVEPENVEIIGDAYRRALAVNRELADDHGLGLFNSQWMHWDRIRRRLEPHENMFPGLEKLPPPNKEQLRRAADAHRETGHMDYGKIPHQSEEGLEMRLKPTRPAKKGPSSMAYLTAPPVLAGTAAAASMRGGREDEQNPYLPAPRMTEAF